MKLNPKILDENITELYSLDYFKIIYYEIHKVENEKIDLVIKVQESQLRKFNLGLKWDNYYDLIATANIQLNSNLLPGLRIEDQIQFAGIQKNIFSIYYPSKKLNFPIYPFFTMENSKFIFNDYNATGNAKRYQYKTNNFSSGIGIILKNFWSTKYKYYYREDSFHPEESLSNEKNIYAGINFSAQLDLLDDILLPSYGVLIKGEYENSSKEWGSNNNYHFYKALGDIYLTYKKNTYRINGYYHQALNNYPKYLITVPNGSQTFSGLKEFQLWGKTLLFSRFEYRYKHKKDIYFHGILNLLISAALIFFSFTGFDFVIELSEETKNATEIIPKGMITGIIIIR